MSRCLLGSLLVRCCFVCLSFLSVCVFAYFVSGRLSVRPSVYLICSVVCLSVSLVVRLFDLFCVYVRLLFFDVGFGLRVCFFVCLFVCVLG